MIVRMSYNKVRMGMAGNLRPKSAEAVEKIIGTASSQEVYRLFKQPEIGWDLELRLLEELSKRGEVSMLNGARGTTWYMYTLSNEGKETINNLQIKARENMLERMQKDADERRKQHG